MKRTPIVVILIVLAGFAWTLKYLYDKSRAAPVVYDTRTPQRTDIIQKTVATGALVPRREVEIKPPVPGVIDQLLIEPGTYVKAGDLLARIRIIPDVVRVNDAESGVKAAEIRLANARRELARSRDLHAKQLISQATLDAAAVEFDLRQQELQAARSNLQLVREGSSRQAGKASNEVRATVEGMVLEVPVKEGGQVIDANSFNAGTTIATIADMNDMIFEGQVDEAEVGKLRVGLKLLITIGALEDQRIEGTLERIAPKGVATDGIIQFQIRATIVPSQDVFIRAGYSANADIVLDRRDDVLAIAESLLQFDRDSGDGGDDRDDRSEGSDRGATGQDASVSPASGGQDASAAPAASGGHGPPAKDSKRGGPPAKDSKRGGQPFVEIEVDTAPQRFERRDVTLGLSDGLTVEILSGLSEGDRIKQYQGERGDQRKGSRRR